MVDLEFGADPTAVEHAAHVGHRRVRLFWLLILFSLGMSDYLTRGWVQGTLG